MKTSELTGAALDWAVAKAENLTNWDDDRLCFINAPHGEDFEPSTNWAQGGAIIERECICIFTTMGVHWWAKIEETGTEFESAAPLIAAMRCYVASKLGDEVNIPEELL
jgi:hypothetical protein